MKQAKRWSPIAYISPLEEHWLDEYFDGLVVGRSAKEQYNEHARLLGDAIINCFLNAQACTRFRKSIG